MVIEVIKNGTRSEKIFRLGEVPETKLWVILKVIYDRLKICISTGK